MWREQLDKILPFLGHRNWILVVDKAFPLQNSEGITYLDTQASLSDVLSEVLDKISEAPHIKPIIYTDKELEMISEDLCHGVADLQESLNSIIKSNTGGATLKTIMHDKVFEMLENASKRFRVVVLKTESTIPYTSIFIELDCGYWTQQKEKTLRQRIEKQNSTN